MHPFNRGYGAALRTGIDAARMPWVLLTDADLQFDLAELEDFVPSTRSSDLLVGYRVRAQRPARQRGPAARRGTCSCGTLFDLPVRDVDCAFKLIRRDLLEQLELVSSGAMISAELLVRLPRRGARIERARSAPPARGRPASRAARTRAS